MWLSCCGCPIYFSDDFGRANSTNLGSNWVEESGDWSIAGTTYIHTSDANAIVICQTPHPTPATAMRLAATVNVQATSTVARMFFDWTDSSNHSYIEWLTGTSGYLKMFVVSGGTATELDGVATLSTSTGTYYFQVGVDQYGVVHAAIGSGTAPDEDTVAAGLAAMSWSSYTPTSGYAGLGIGSGTGTNIRYNRFDMWTNSEDCGNQTCVNCSDVYPTEYEVVVEHPAACWDGTYYLPVYACGWWELALSPSRCTSSYPLGYSRIRLRVTNNTAGCGTGKLVEFWYFSPFDNAWYKMAEKTFCDSTGCVFTNESFTNTGGTITITITAIGG